MIDIEKYKEASKHLNLDCLDVMGQLDTDTLGRPLTPVLVEATFIKGLFVHWRRLDYLQKLIDRAYSEQEIEDAE